MTILSPLNSLLVYAVCGGIIAFVALVCIVFMVPLRHERKGSCGREDRYPGERCCYAGPLVDRFHQLHGDPQRCAGYWHHMVFL